MKVEITETLQRTVNVVARPHDDALDIVKRRYNIEAIVLDTEDFVDVKFEEIE